MESPYLTASEVAQYARVDVATVRRWIATGQLPATKAGSKLLRVHKDQLQRFLNGLST